MVEIAASLSRLAMTIYLDLENVPVITIPIHREK